MVPTQTMFFRQVGALLDRKGAESHIILKIICKREKVFENVAAS